ncbi:MAG: T9SS type A sorting domain-containing protein [Flavobacteriales bacterium]|nr:T9SS type A sorting domain-containing protein [Flavobacteriales bacterium]
MRTAFLSLLVLMTLSARSQENHNDDCGNAQQVPVSSGNTHTEWALANMNEAASAITPAACSGSGYQDVWFRFTATASTHYIVWVGAGAAQVRVEAFSGNCGSLTSIGCVTGNNHLALTGLTGGTSYLFRAYATMTNWYESYVYVAVVSAPLNDDCAGAIPLTVQAAHSMLEPTTEGSTVGATMSSNACTPGSESHADDDVWFSFVATKTQHLLTVAGSGLSLQVTSGTCVSPTQILCKASTNGREILTGLTMGQTYHVRVYTASNLATVRQRFRIGVFDIAVNDECSGAIPIDVDASNDEQRMITAPTAGSSSSAQPSGCTASNYDVWYSFVAPATAVYMRDLTDAGYYSVYSGSCGSLACIIAHNQSPAVATGLVPGNTYYLAVGQNNSPNILHFTVRELPSNDECANAVALTVQSNVDDITWTDCDTHGATQSSPACSGQAATSDDDVWYSFVAPQDKVTMRFLQVEPGSNVTGSVELFSGNCGSLTSLLCTSAAASTDFTGLTVGSTYHFRLYTGGQNETTRFVKRLALTAIVNDDCAGALPLSPVTLSDYPNIDRVFPAMGSSTVPACNGTADDDLWYTFTPTSTSAAFIGAAGAENFTAELFTGGCGALTSVNCRANLPPTNFRVNYGSLTPGATYHLRVYTTATALGNFVPMYFDQPANDEPAGAYVVQPAGTPFTFPITTGNWTYGASQSFGRMCGNQGTPDDDVWYRFTATQASHTITAVRSNPLFDESQPAGNITIEAYRGFYTDSLGLDSVVLGCGQNTLALSGLTVGQQVLFRAYSTGNTFNHIYALRVNVSGTNNDEATGAVQLPFTNDWLAAFDTDGATQSQPPANCEVTDVSDDDIWFKFTATSQPGRIVVGQHDADLTLELFGGTPGNLTSIACSGNILVLPTNLTSGQTYYCRVYSWANAAPVYGYIGLWQDPSLTANDCVDEACLGPVLLSNPGIEQGGVCAPVYTDQGSEMNGTPLAPGWWHAGSGTADSYNSCARWNSSEEVPATPYSSDRQVNSRRGKGMAGMYVRFPSNYGEYMQARLTQPLTPGAPYLVSFHVSGYGGQRVTDGLGALLTTTPFTVTSTQVAELIPQVLAAEPFGAPRWMNVCGIVVPNEPFEYLTIGLFLPNAYQNGSGSSLEYYFIDDVVVAQITDPNCVMGLGDVPDEQDRTSGATGDELRLYPNPASDRVTMMLDGSITGKRGVIEVFDATGKRVQAEQITSLSALQTVELSQGLREGLYMVVLRVDGMQRSARIVLKR